MDEEKPKVSGLKRTYAENPINSKKKSKVHFEDTVIDRLDRIEIVLNELLASIVHSDDEQEDIPITQCLE